MKRDEEIIRRKVEDWEEGLTKTENIVGLWERMAVPKARANRRLWLKLSSIAAALLVCVVAYLRPFTTDTPRPLAKTEVVGESDTTEVDEQQPEEYMSDPEIDAPACMVGMFAMPSAEFTYINTDCLNSKI